MHRPSTGPVVADRHHRAPDHRRQAVAVRGQGRLHQPDRRLLHGRPHDRPPRRRRAPQRRRAATPLGDGGALGPRQPVPLPRLPPCPPRRWPARLDGTRRGLRRQRGNGDLVQPAAEQRPEPASVGDREQLRLAIVVWIQRTYHRHRRQDSLGRLTPIAYETPYAPLTPHGSTYPTESTKVGGRPLNLGPHPYQLNAGNRCAYDRFRRSRPTVGARSYAFNQRIGMRSSGLESTHTWLLLAFGTTSYRILCTARLPAVRSFLSQGCSGCDARPSPCATGEEVWRGGAGPGTLALSRFQAEGPGRWRSVIGCSHRSTPAPGPRVAPRAGG